MKTLISGIVGAAVAATAWLALEHVTQMDFGWLACLVGLVTGISVHLGAGAHARESFARGALAVVLTLAACVGGRMLYVSYVRSISVQLSTHVAQFAERVEGKVKADAAVGEADATVDGPMSVSSREADRSTSLQMQKPNLNMTISQWDMLWLCLAALAAYVTGKGFDRQPAVKEPAATEVPPANP